MSFSYESYEVDDAVAAVNENVRPLNWKIWLNEDGAEYETHLRLGFEFIRRNSDRRYSTRTLQAILQAADEAENLRVYDINRPTNLPALITLTRPISYDEETEVKSGGLAAAGVLFAGDDGRFVITTAPQFRRNGIGRALMRIANHMGPVTVYANNGNYDGQRFLLACNLMPISISSVGTVSYSASIPQVEADDGSSDRLRRLRGRGRNQDNPF